jgi:RND family efflux transporter MFP subunit
LDTSQYDPQVAAQEAATNQARQQIGIAQSESAAAGAQAGEAESQIAAQSNNVAQAQHQAEVARAIIAQKKSTLKAVQSQGSKMRSVLQVAQNNYQAQLAAQSEAQSDVNVAQQMQAAAQANVAAAKTRIDDAQADVEYWNAELPRIKVLLKGGAVSQQTYASELAQSKRATAKVEDAQAQLQAAQADVRVATAKIQSAESKTATAIAKSAASKSRIAKAKASVQQADALLEAAKADVNQAQGAAKAVKAQVNAALSTLQAQRQAADAAKSNAAAASGRIGAAQSGAQQAQAQLSSAEINKGYTLIRSQVDGVVTKRLISPGVLVHPGQAILQVAQINPIRLQANVAEEDLTRIHLGSQVSISSTDSSAKPVAAQVTSITPSVDAASHMGMVEAVVNNPKNKFLPGQYVKMAINVGQSKNVLRVPSSAIQWLADPNGSIETISTKPYVWIAKPETGQANSFTAQQMTVRLGATNGDVTAVVSGLKTGEMVVLGNQLNLSDGMALSNATAPQTPMAMPAMNMPGMKM